MWNLKYDTNELFYETENRLVIAKGQGVQGVGGWIGSLGLALAKHG